MTYSVYSTSLQDSGAGMTDTDNRKDHPGRDSCRILIVMVMILFLTAWVPGCLNIINKQIGAGQVTDPDTSTNLSSGNANRSTAPSPSGLAIVSPSPVQNPPPWIARHGYGTDSGGPVWTPAAATTLSSSPSSPDLVTSAFPELTPDPYPSQHAMQVNTPPEPLHRIRRAEFRTTYVLRGNSTGLVVNATKLEGPLWISFDVEPLHDCLEDAESCRGDEKKTISRPYFTLTVRDNQTREIVAEDGYGGIYSSQKTNRTTQIYREGRYHLTLTGNSVDIMLTIATGAAPTMDDIRTTATDSPQAKTLPPEVLRRIQGGV